MSPFGQALARLAAASPRERAGFMLVAMVAAVFLAAANFDWTMRAHGAAQQAADTRARAEAVVARAGEQGFQEQMALSAGKVWRWSVVEQSVGVARANATTALESLALSAGLANVVVTAEEGGEEPASGEIGAIVLVLTAEFDWASFVLLLHTLETSEISFSVEALEATPAGDRPATFTMQLRAPFLREAPP